MTRATMRGICTHRGRIACVAGLTAALALGAGIPALTGTPEPALAATAATRGELASLQKEVSRAAGTYTDATSRAAELNEQVRTAADDILRIEQELMPQVQNRAALAARAVQTPCVQRRRPLHAPQRRFLRRFPQHDQVPGHRAER
ncbi:MAG: hypothetical protein ACLTKG_01415 [Collinsella intestinalis]